MNHFESKLVKNDVTSVKIFNNLLFLGCGGHLCIFCYKNNNLIERLEVFQGIKIHGIDINIIGDNIILYGRDLLKIYQLNCDTTSDGIITTTLRENASARNRSWILNAKWLDNNKQIATIVTENNVYLWNLDLTIIRQSVCNERCLLYSGILLYEKWSDLVALSGTVFSEILIWKPATNARDQTSPVLRTLIGHKGVIFSLDYNPNCNIICSTSDDRSTILWNIGKSLSEELLHSENSIKCNCKVYGHQSRVFRCKLLHEHFVTGGEDGLVNLWNLDGTLCKKFETQQGSQVWALDVDESERLIVAGVANGGVVVFPYQFNFIENVLRIPDCEVPKKVVLLSNNNIVTITDKGSLFLYINSTESWSKIDVFETMISYVLLEVSKCRKLVSISSRCI